MTAEARRATPGWSVDTRGPRMVALALAALYLALLPLHLTVLSGSARATMATSAAVSAALTLSWWAWARARPHRVTSLSMDLLGVVPLVNCLLHLAVAQDLKQTSVLMLTLVGIGAAVTGRSTAVVLSAGASATWVVLVATLPDAARTELVHYATGMASALLLSAVVFGLRSRREALLLSSVVAVERSRADRELHERRFTSMFQESPVGIGLADEHGHFVAANPALCRLFGRALPELLGRSSLGFTHPDDQLTHGRARTLLDHADDGVVRVEKRYVRPSGELRWAWLTITRIEGPGGEPWTLAHVQDVTERKATERELADSEANLAAVGAVVRRIRTGADAREAILTAVAELSGAQSTSIFEPADDDALVATAAFGAVTLGTRIATSAPSATASVYRSGRPLFVADAASHPLVAPELAAQCGSRSLHFQPVIADGVVTGVIAVAWSEPLAALPPRVAQALELLADETAVALEHDLLLSRLALLATTDSLTGLPNRRAWDDRLGQLLTRARRTGEPLTVAMIDLDHFKAFNDTHGHVRGDALLATTSRRFAAQLREVDLLARWGGEEFAVALPHCTADEAAAILQRLRGEVSHGQTCSVGHATWDGRETPEHLLARADAALYDAKATGRDRSVAAPVPAPRRAEEDYRSRPA